MNATGLPIQTAPATPAPPTTDPVAPTGAQAPADFVLALAQMIGASAPATSVAAQVTASLPMRDEELATDPGDVAAALSLLPFAIPQTQPQLIAQQQNSGTAQSEALDPLEMLGLTTRPDNVAARDAAILKALTERLAAIDEAPAETQVTSGSPLPTQEATQVRASPPEATAASARSLQSPVGTRAWADELGSRVTMMTNKGEHIASLRLSPEHLGPLEVRIAMREDQASVWFGAAHADTRAAIEHALPRLRELFAAQGMSLADAGVFREPPRQHVPDVQGARTGVTDTATAIEPTGAMGRVQVGLLDAYA